MNASAYDWSTYPAQSSWQMIVVNDFGGLLSALSIHNRRIEYLNLYFPYLCG